MKQFYASLRSYVPEELLRANKDFVIAWISVENKQGDEKGIMVIWPACLCLSLLSTINGPEEQNSDRQSFAYSRRTLPTLPEMPLALQPSPIPAHAAVPTQRLTSPSVLTTGDSGLFSSKEPSPQLDLLPTNTITHNSSLARKLRRISAVWAPRAFRATGSRFHDHSDLAETAFRAGTYVDAIVKERERERDRKRKERETSVSASMATKDSPAQHALDSPDVSLASFQQLPTPGNMGFSTIHTPNSTTLTAAQLVSSPVYASPLATQIAQPTYPSPPDDIISRERSISHPLSADFSASGLAFQQQAIPKPEPFDTFGSMDNLMADITLGYGMGADKMLSKGLATISATQSQENFDSFGAFTDDDFNFFDDPISTSLSAIPTYTNGPSAAESFLSDPAISSTVDTSENLLKALNIESVSPTDFFSSLSVPVIASNSLPPTPADPLNLATSKPSKNGDIKDIVFSTFGSTEAPDLAHSPSDRSSTSPTGPPTPDAFIIPSSELDQDDLFQPLRFRSHHQMADAKYMSGKFSSSIVPESEEETLAGIRNWRGPYSLATDPGTRIVKRLVGMKRRQTSQGGRQTPDVVYKNGAYDDIFSVSDEEIEDDDLQNTDTDSDESDVESDGAISSRPSTPLPSYVPLGPSLVATHLSHALLFPISVSLRPAGASFSDPGLPSPLAANAVPTPISPSATGGRSRNTKATELLANALCGELIDNAVWADDWRALHSVKKSTDQESSSSEDVFYDNKYMLSGSYFVESMSINKILDFGMSTMLLKSFHF